MSAKKILINSVAAITIASTAYFAYVMKRALKFKRSLDHTPDSLDDCVVCCGKHKTVGAVTMKDAKLGAFCGYLSVDLSQAETHRKQYDMDIEVQSGCVNLTVPENFQVDINGSATMSGVVDITKHSTKDNNILLSVFSNVNCGALIIKNPPIEAESTENILDTQTL